MKNIFDRTVTDELVARIDRLSPSSSPRWGKMDVAQMLAHCCKPYETIFDAAYAAAHPKPNVFVRFLLARFFKPIVVSETAYKRNARTAPEFIVADRRDLETERRRLIDCINKVQALGAAHFAGKEAHSFGPMTTQEWNNLFYKHLDHHLSQFGV
jgi:hypothetical protein